MRATLFHGDLARCTGLLEAFCVEQQAAGESSVCTGLISAANKGYYLLSCWTPKHVVLHAWPIPHVKHLLRANTNV